MSFCRQFWYDLCNLVNTPRLDKGFFFFLRKFQPMTFAPDDKDDNTLSSDQDTNKFLV